MQFDKKTIWFSGLILVLLVSNLLTYSYLKSQPIKQTNNNLDKPEVIATSSETESGNDVTPTPPLPINQLLVSWNEWPAKVRAVGDVLNQDMFYSECEKLKKQPYVPALCNDFTTVLKAQSIGQVSEGKYKGGELFLLAETPEGPAFRDNYYRVVKLDRKVVVLTKESDSIEYTTIPKGLFATDTVSMIDNLEPPPELTIPNSVIKLKRSGGFFSKYFLTDYKNPEKKFEYAKGKWVYWDEAEGCYLVAASDGTVRQYDFALPFFVKQATTSEMAAGQIAEETLRVKFNNSDKFTNESYNIRPVGGCGSTGCLDYVPFIVTGNDVAKSLVLSATSEQGDKFYEFSDLTVKFKALDRITGTGLKMQTAKEYLESIYNLYYPNWNEKLQKQNDKMLFADFVKKHPVLFWQDPFGKYVRLSRNEFAPGVECGKPVIYLYPLETTTVSVQVRPNGGITKSEPAYGEGWMVEAKPNGELKNLADQKIYGSLFWEGGGIDYLPPTEGFVVAVQDVEKFLDEKLILLGLNKKEAGEFKEFWLPRMQSAKYYKISFVSQQEFDRIAPLTITPRPDKVIRVFMDYQALEVPIKIAEPQIKTPLRHGFTVVEWGGALR